MILRSNLPLLLTCLAVAGCTTKADALGFGDLQPYSLDASDLTANDAGADAAALGSDSAIPGPDASTGAAPDHPEAGTPEASSGEDAGGAGDAGGNDASGANAETGRLVGITAAHNAVRAMISTQPPLPDLTWSPTLAAYAQAWATQLASSPSTCMNPQHRSGAELQAKDYGENLADFSVSGAPGNASNAQQAVDDWAAEKMCWTYGTILGTEQCDMTCTTMLASDGCGHYTQIAWRDSVEVGCGVATCQNGMYTEDIWICNYSPAGNIAGQAPY